MTTNTISNDGTNSSSTMTSNFTIGKINVSQMRAKVEAKFTSLVNGINTLLTDVTTFTFRNQAFPKATVLGTLQARITAAENTKAARIALHNAVAAEAAAATAAAPFVKDMKSYVATRYGATSPTMQTFGFTQEKTPQKSAASKAQAAAKAKATRAAIGTKGPKQRKVAAAAANAAAAQASAVPAATVPAATAGATNGSGSNGTSTTPTK